MKGRAIAVLLAVCPLMAAAQAVPGPTAPLADRLPARTLAYAGWAGRGLAFDGSMFGQLLNDPDIAKIVQTIGEAIRKDIPSAAKKDIFTRAWAMGGIAWQHPVAVALIDLKKGEHGPTPTAALLIDLDTDREAFAKQLDGLLKVMTECSYIRLTDATLGSVSYRVNARSADMPEISFGYIGNVLFVGIGADAPKAIIEPAVAGKLSADKNFVKCLQAVAAGDVQMAYYMDVSGMVGKLEQFVPAPAGLGPPRGAGEQDAAQARAGKIRRLIVAMGLDKVSAAAGATGVVDRGLYSRTRIFTPAPHRGLLLALAGPAITDEDLSAVPDDADFLLAAKVSPQAAWDELRRAIKDVDPNADSRFAKAVGGFERRLGVSLGKDVLSQLGDTWVLSSAPSRGGFLTGTMLTVDVKDPAKLAAAIGKIESALLPPPAPATTAPAGAGKASPGPTSRPSVETLKFARADIHYLALPSAFAPMPLAPAWTLHKNHLLVAAWPQVIQSAIAVNAPASPVTQTADFRPARSRVAGKPSVLFYCNGPKMARQVYNWALIGWTAGANKLAALGFKDARPTWLPPLTTVEQYLRPSIVAVCPDAEGITFETYGSLPSAVPAAGMLLNPVPVWLSTLAVEKFRAEAVTAARLAGRASQTPTAPGRAKP